MAVSKTKKSFVKMKKIKAQLIECRKNQKLDLGSLELTEVPEEFMSLVKAAGVTNVSELDLHNNALSELPQDLEDFRILKVLKLGKNRFQEFPSAVLFFAKLQILDLSENELKEMHESIGHLTSLRELNYASNQLIALPNIWGQLTSLVTLNISKNRLMSLPESLGSLRNLQRLDVSRNLLSTIPNSLQNLQELIYLDIYGNHIVEIPSSLGSLKHLAEFNCSGNPLEEPANSLFAQGFEKFMDHLRNLHELHILEELIRKKPEATIEGSYKRHCTRCEAGQRPVVRTGHSITPAGPIIYFFGGRIANYGKVEEIFVIDTRTLLWVKPSTNGTVPSARDGHAAAIDENRRLYIFGGRNDENKLLNDVYFLDLKTLSWFQPHVEGTIPSVREGASMKVVGTNIVLFGGRGMGQRYNDVHVLDTQTWTWTLQKTRGSIPAPRQNAAVAVSGTKFFVHGGKGSLMFEDLHALDISSYTWSRVIQKGLGPSPRQNHTAWIHQNRLYIVGGSDAKGEPLSSLYVLFLGNETRISANTSVQAQGGNTQEANGISQYKENTWVQLESELTPSLTNVYCYFEDKVIVLKEGAELLIPLKEDNLTEEGSCTPPWDIYMETSCDRLKPKETLYEDEELVYKSASFFSLREGNITTEVLEVTNIQIERRMDSKTARVNFTIQFKMMELPKLYRVLSNKEKRLLQHVKNFQERFMQLFPFRRPLMLIACNECNVEKFVCTTIRPSHVGYADLYYWEGCSEFLANFLTYEPLENPTSFPKYLPSSFSVMNWQKGDCFDFSVAMVSLLAGAGYEAFCVVGYAPLRITSNNQEDTECPGMIAEKNEAKRGKVSLIPRQQTKKTEEATVKYALDTGPLFNNELLRHKKSERDGIVQSFINEFKDAYDHELKYGQGEEEDTILAFFQVKSKMSLASSEKSIEEKEEIKEAPESSDEIRYNSLNLESNQVQVNIQDTSHKPKDPLYKNRLHCWVMVASGKRDVPERFFLDPVSGLRYSIHDAPYEAVEYIWNQHNVWINMQVNPSRSGIEGMSWDLTDVTKWERVLDTLFSFNDMQGKCFTPGCKEDNRSTPRSGSNSARKTIEPLSLDKEKTGSPRDQILVSKMETGPADINHGSAINAVVSAIAKPTPKQVGNADGSFMESFHALLPSSWVNTIQIPVAAFVTRCPKGVKKTFYHRCTHELYSFYGDYVRWDGLIERIVYFGDNERTIILESHDYFQRRKDCLYKRIFFHTQNKVHDFFRRGAGYGLKEMEVSDRQVRKFLFYPSSRSDGLLSREEVIGKKMVEIYDSQESCLIYRCIHYGTPLPPPRDDSSPKMLDQTTATEVTTRGSLSRGSVHQDRSSRPMSRSRTSVESQRGKSRPRILSRWRGSTMIKNKVMTPGSDKRSERNLSIVTSHRRTAAEKLLPITRISQKFQSISREYAQKSVAKQVFKINADQIRVDYHPMDRHITASSKLYSKDGTLSLLEVDPFEQESETFAKMDEFHGLLMAEREAIKAVRDAEREIEDILQQRLKEEQNVVLFTPYTDAAQVNQDDLLHEDEDVSKKSDYLSSFLPPGIRLRQKLTHQQMVETRDGCLKALKERLIHQANIIQNRYDEETALLAKKRANFERDREQMSVEDEEAYNEACEEALFRIRILELRAKQHQEEALNKYAEMEKKLQSNPRLARLYSSSKSS